MTKTHSLEKAEDRTNKISQLGITIAYSTIIMQLSTIKIAITYRDVQQILSILFDRQSNLIDDVHSAD